MLPVAILLEAQLWCAFQNRLNSEDSTLFSSQSVLIPLSGSRNNPLLMLLVILVLIKVFSFIVTQFIIYGFYHKLKRSLFIVRMPKWIFNSVHSLHNRGQYIFAPLNLSHQILWQTYHFPNVIFTCLQIQLSVLLNAAHGESNVVGRVQDLVWIPSFHPGFLSTFVPSLSCSYPTEL